MDAIWKDILFCNSYQVNQFGQVRNARTKRIKTPTLDKGHLYIGIYKNGFQRNFRLAILVLEAFSEISVQPYKHNIIYKDANRLNCSFDNLVYGKTEVRQRQAARIWRLKTIKKLLQDGVKQSEIARRLGVSQALITRVKKGERGKGVY